MSDLTCACLFDARGPAILLVRVRQNTRWYLPGGKIEPGETPEQALSREIGEELGLRIGSRQLIYRNTVVGPAYGSPGAVRLVCFESRVSVTDPRPSAEISEVAWLDELSLDLFAPAVRQLYRAWKIGQF
jgi:8-oxo-dGTP diphosphatase